MNPIQTIIAAAVTAFIVVTGARYGDKGLKGAGEALVVAIAVAAILSVLLLPGTDWIYVRQKKEVSETEMFRDIASAANTVAGVFSNKPQESGPSWDQGTVPKAEGPTWSEPQPAPQPTSQPQQPTQPQQPAQQPTQPATQLLPQDQLGKCWLEAAIKDGIKTAYAGGTSWFPAGTNWHVYEEKRFGPPIVGGRNEWYVTCRELGIYGLQITHNLGKQLQKTADPGGNFYGTGSWPPSCYVTAEAQQAPEPAPEEPQSLPTPAPTTAPEKENHCPAGTVVPAGTAGYYVGTPPELQVEGGLFEEPAVLTGESFLFGGMTICQTTSRLEGGRVWLWFP